MCVEGTTLFVRHPGRDTIHDNLSVWNFSTELCTTKRCLFCLLPSLMTAAINIRQTSSLWSRRGSCAKCCYAAGRKIQFGSAQTTRIRLVARVTWINKFLIANPGKTKLTWSYKIWFLNSRGEIYCCVNYDYKTDQFKMCAFFFLQSIKNLLQRECTWALPSSTGFTDAEKSTYLKIYGVWRNILYDYIIMDAVGRRLF